MHGQRTLETIDVEHTFPWKTFRFQMLCDRRTLRIVWRDDTHILVLVVVRHEVPDGLNFGTILVAISS
jgi:hypothetical protein